MRGLSITLTIVMLGSAAGAVYFWQDIQRRIRKADLDELAPVAGGALNMLVIGTDSREFVESREDARRFGRVGGKRADTIMLVQAVPSDERAVLVQFPRDLWVRIPGHGEGKINRSFEDGPQSVIDTVQQLTGVGINHYVQVDFDGFRRLVDAIGGIDVCIDHAMRDGVLNFRLPAGVNHLDGETALSFVRSRHADPDGDFGRIRRQQQFLRTIVSKVTDRSILLQPWRLHGLATAFAENVTTDQDFDLRGMLAVAKNVRNVSPERMKTYTVPGEIGREGRESVVHMDDERADRLFGALRDVVDPEKALAPEPVRLRVEDRSGKAIAGKVAEDLTGRGFVVTGTTIGTSVQSSTQVIAPRSVVNDARRVVAVLQGAKLLYGGTEIKLVIGSRFQGLIAPPKGEAPSPSGPCANFNGG